MTAAGIAARGARSMQTHHKTHRGYYYLEAAIRDFFHMFYCFKQERRAVGKLFSAAGKYFVLL